MFEVNAILLLTNCQYHINAKITNAFPPRGLTQSNTNFAKSPANIPLNFWYPRSEAEGRGQSCDASISPNKINKCRRGQRGSRGGDIAANDTRRCRYFFIANLKHKLVAVAVRSWRTEGWVLTKSDKKAIWILFGTSFMYRLGFTTGNVTSNAQSTGYKFRLEFLLEYSSSSACNH